VPEHEATHLLPPHAASIVLARRAVVDRRGALHMEIRDPGPGPRPDAKRGMGWRILERMADRWGSDRRDGLARVWFELDAAP
jgi:anti-sigma regulatory factor (Ser/Thr protein kinase)